MYKGNEEATWISKWWSKRGGRKIETTTVQAYFSFSLDTGMWKPMKGGTKFYDRESYESETKERERERGRGLRCWILSTISDRVVSVSLHVRATTLTDAFFSATPLTSSTAYTRCSFAHVLRSKLWFQRWQMFLIISSEFFFFFLDFAYTQQS